MEPSDLLDNRRPLPGWLAVALVAGTSAAVLVLEILAARLLAPYVGVSLETYTGIIAVVLAGIAVGAWVGGWVVDRVDPRRLLPVLLTAGGALALLTIPTVRIVGQSGIDGPSGVLVLATLGFLPSATVLSAIPPAVVKLQLHDLDATGSVVGRLSAWGTAGAIIGTLTTGFVLVAVAAVTSLIVAVAAALLLAGVIMWLADPRATRSAGGTGTAMASAIGVALLAGGGVVATDNPCETQTRYYCVSVVDDVDRPTGRVLILDDLRHSYVDVDDPTYLDFWYVRQFAGAIDAAAADGPLSVGHIGGGAFTMPDWVRATRPGSEQVVFEIDGDLVDLVVEQFDVDVGAGTGVDVRVGDARLSLGELDDDSLDVVLGDAFGSRSVPWHLATSEFVEEIRRVLRPDGIYVLNLIDEGAEDFLRAEAATLDSVFDHVAVVLGPNASAGRLGNSVLIAGDAPVDPGLIDPDGGRVVEDLTTFVGGASVLTDDFAPVDQLIAGGR